MGSTHVKTLMHLENLCFELKDIAISSFVIDLFVNRALVIFLII
jgi:hypothetical protein